MVNVTRTYLPERDKLDKYIDQIFESRWLTNNGPFVQELQKRLTEYLGVKNLLLVSNGTLALQIAYKLLKIKGKVITTPFTFVATISSQVWQNIEPVFVDIDRDTFNMDHQLLEQALTKGISAIVPVHVFGNPCNVRAIDAIARKNNLKVIYDAAHTFGIQYDGQSVLNYGDISILSFHSTKVFHTIEGGALVINDDRLYEKAKLMVNFGISGVDQITELGINAKMNEFQAIMGLSVLDDMDEILARRKYAYDYYRENLPSSLKTQQWNLNSNNNYSYYPVIFANEAILLQVIEELNKRGIKPRRYFYPSLNNLPYLKERQSMLNSGNIASLILCLPLFDSIKREDQDSVIQVIREYAQ